MLDPGRDGAGPDTEEQRNNHTYDEDRDANQQNSVTPVSSTARYHCLRHLPSMMTQILDKSNGPNVPFVVEPLSPMCRTAAGEGPFRRSDSDSRWPCDSPLRSSRMGDQKGHVNHGFFPRVGSHVDRLQPQM